MHTQHTQRTLTFACHGLLLLQLQLLAALCFARLPIIPVIIILQDKNQSLASMPAHRHGTWCLPCYRLSTPWAGTPGKQDAQHAIAHAEDC